MLSLHIADFLATLQRLLLPLIVAGMLLQAAALGALALGSGAVGAAIALSVLLGLGTALVYPTLIAPSPIT